MPTIHQLFVSSLTAATLDIFVTRTDQSVDRISVDPPMLSDYSQIVGSLATRVPHTLTGVRQGCRRWRSLDIDSFTADLLQSPLVSDPPAGVDDRLVCLLQRRLAFAH